MGDQRVVYLRPQSYRDSVRVLTGHWPQGTLTDARVLLSGTSKNGGPGLLGLVCSRLHYISELPQSEVQVFLCLSFSFCKMRALGLTR